jgi:hypothetical protein
MVTKVKRTNISVSYVVWDIINKYRTCGESMESALCRLIKVASPHIIMPADQPAGAQEPVTLQQVQAPAN